MNIDQDDKRTDEDRAYQRGFLAGLERAKGLVPKHGDIGYESAPSDRQIAYLALLELLDQEIKTHSPDDTVLK